VLVLTLLAAVLPLVTSSYHTFQFTQVLVYAIALLGLNMLTGYNGQISLGHGAFFAIGAYVAAILMDRYDVPYWATLPVAAVVCWLAGFLFGLPALRLEGLYLSLATFALGVALPQLLKYKHLAPWTGGVQGIVLTKPAAPFGLPLSPDVWLYYFTLGVALLMFLLAWNLLHGRIGRAMLAIRDQPVAAAAMGVNTALVKSATFGVSAMYTGVAGALGAIVVQFVAPDSFPLFLSITLLIGIVIGGLASFSGAIFGALFIQFVPNFTSQISKAAPWAIYGVCLIGFMYALPGGIAGGLFRLRAALRHRRLGPVVGALGLGGLATAIVLSSSAPSSGKQYDPGASDTEIKLGNIMPYSGPASAWSTIGKAEAAYFRKINAEGGIYGRKINFVSLDDAYSPPKTVEAARRLVEQDQVLLVYGALGTAPNLAIRRYLNAKKVPHLFVSSGARAWNDPTHFPWTMGLLAEYRTEAKIYATHVLQTRPNARIGVLYQNDDYGKDYLDGLKEGLGAGAGQIVAALSYETSDPTVDSQIVQLKGSGADVFFNFSGARFAAQAIRKAYDIGWRPVQYLNVPASSIGSVLVPAGVEKAIGIVTSIYLKDPTSSQWADDPAVRDYFAFLDQYYPECNRQDVFGTYGYVSAQAMVQVLRQAGDVLTRENVMRQAANLRDFQPALVLPGIKLNTSPTDYAPLESLQLARFDGRNWVPFGEVMGR
jgi:branched-chain amino acid transport system substrate-binding protein